MREPDPRKVLRVREEARRTASILESVERQKARHREHLAQLDTLFASLQQRAFKGEL